MVDIIVHEETGSICFFRISVWCSEFPALWRKHSDLGFKALLLVLTTYMRKGILLKIGFCIKVAIKVVEVLVGESFSFMILNGIPPLAHLLLAYRPPELCCVTGLCRLGGIWL